MENLADIYTYVYVWIRVCAYIGFIHWEVKKVKAFGDWTPFFGIDEMLEGYKTLNYLRSNFRWTNAVTNCVMSQRNINRNKYDFKTSIDIHKCAFLFGPTSIHFNLIYICMYGHRAPEYTSFNIIFI